MSHSVGKVVIQCHSTRAGHCYRVWTERDGMKFGGIETDSAVEAAKALMDRYEDGAAWIPEPGRSEARLDDGPPSE